jgi:hypothetical protein
MVFSFRHRWVFTLGESRVELFSPCRAIGPNKKGREAFDPPRPTQTKNRGVRSAGGFEILWSDFQYTAGRPAK